MLDLFAGIGGFSLAGHWAGFETEQFVEIDPFCQRVLAKNFPGVPIHGDITTFSAVPLRGRIDVVTGGFPCQDISPAGKGAGINGGRSGLWSEMLRVVRECRPLFVLAENSHYLRTRGADRVLGDLEGAGYAGWACVVGAGTAGAPHLRRRAFVLAADADRLRELQREGALLDFGGWDLHGSQEGGLATHAESEQDRRLLIGGLASDAQADARGVQSFVPWRDVEPPVPGVDAGLPGRVDRARALGNTVVPQVAYQFLRAIAEMHATHPRPEKQGTTRGEIDGRK